jgi:hypothetical protein
MKNREIQVCIQSTVAVSVRKKVCFLGFQNNPGLCPCHSSPVVERPGNIGMIDNCSRVTFSIIYWRDVHVGSLAPRYSLCSQIQSQFHGSLSEDQRVRDHPIVCRTNYNENHVLTFCIFKVQKLNKVQTLKFNSHIPIKY